MTKDEIFLVWAPPDGPWSAWVKPVLFAHMDREIAPALKQADPRQLSYASNLLPSYSNSEQAESDARIPLSMIPPGDGKTAIFVDLPGASSVQAGLELTELGYRPVPLYNAIPRHSNAVPTMTAFSFRSQPRMPKSLVELGPIVDSLYFGTQRLEQAALQPHAPPAFLIHAERRHRNFRSREGYFDNRSIVQEADLPSAQRLKQHGITTVLLVQRAGALPAPDLSYVLRTWRDAGLEMKLLSLSLPTAGLTPLVLPKPSGWSNCWFAIVTSGLHRDRGGSFGQYVPQSS